MDNFKIYIKDKKVLDIGCVGQVATSIFKKHSDLEKQNPRLLVGIDTNKKGIEEGKKLGYIMKTCDITNNRSVATLRNYKFDAAFLLHTIEHIDNTGLALDNLSKVLEPGGFVIVTTPNLMSKKWIHQMATIGVLRINGDHVHWFCQQTLQALFERHGYVLHTYLSDKFEPGLLGVFRWI